MELVLGCYFKMTYKEYLVKSMNYLSTKKNTIFLGQSVSFSGNAIYNTLSEINHNKKVEMPVFEDTQMGFSIGLALKGFVPISCYPRYDFLVCASNQLINHLDKIEYLTKRKNIKVIIRTSIGSKNPLDGGPQHTQDHTKGLKEILKNVNVIKLRNKKDIFSSYKKAYCDQGSFLMVEYGDYYNK